MGMIMVMGIVAKNGILLLDADHRFRRLGFSPEEAMIQAGRRRLRPIAMTALATVAGMLPLAFGIGAGSADAQASRHRRRRRHSELHGPFPGLHPNHPLPPATPPCIAIRGLNNLGEGRYTPYTFPNSGNYGDLREKECERSKEE